MHSQQGGDIVACHQATHMLLIFPPLLPTHRVIDRPFIFFFVTYWLATRPYCGIIFSLPSLCFDTSAAAHQHTGSPPSIPPPPPSSFLGSRLQGASPSSSLERRSSIIQFPNQGVGSVLGICLHAACRERTKVFVSSGDRWCGSTEARVKWQREWGDSPFRFTQEWVGMSADRCNCNTLD